MANEGTAPLGAAVLKRLPDARSQLRFERGSPCDAPLSQRSPAQHSPARRSPDAVETSLSGAERQLWCSVIERALQDALDNVGCIGAPAERDRLADEARRWFADAGHDFRYACDAAGYEFEPLRVRALALIAARKGAAPAAPAAPAAIRSDRREEILV